jgi:hypothetical protein
MATARDIEIVSAVMSRVLNQDGYAYDNIFGRIPLIKYLMIKDQLDTSIRINGRVRELDGGQDIEIPLEYAQENSAQAFDGLEEITFTAKEILTNAKYDWKHVVQTITMDKKDILKAQGVAKKLASLTETHLRNGMKSMATSLNTMLLSEYSAVGAKDFHSIPQIVKDAPSGTGSIGGIDPSSSVNSWWRNRYQDSAATTYQLLVNEITNIVNDIKGNIAGDGPDLCLTDQYVYEYFIAYQTAKGTHSFNNSEMAKLMNMEEVRKVRGMDVIWDNSVPESTAGSKSRVLCLNTDYLQICVHQDRKFDVTKEIDLLAGQKQDAVAWAIFLMGNLTCSNRSKQGVIFDVAQNLTA